MFVAFTIVMICYFAIVAGILGAAFVAGSKNRGIGPELVISLAFLALAIVTLAVS